MKQDALISGITNAGAEKSYSNSNLANNRNAIKNNYEQKQVEQPHINAEKNSSGGKNSNNGKNFNSANAINNMDNVIYENDGFNNPRAINEKDLYNSENISEKIEKEIDRVNEGIKFTNKKFAYHKHEQTNQFYVDVIDSSTGEVIRQIPSQEELDMIAKLRELAGLVIDEKI